jgi:hypothetical protein
MIKETFTTHITFTSGDSHREDPITAESLSSTITRLCDGPAAVMGIIDRAIIVDQADRICVEIKGNTIVYPMELHLKQRKHRLAVKVAARKKKIEKGGK